MDSKNTRQEQRANVARELGRMIRRQARQKWSAVRMAERNRRGHHVWRFRTDTDSRERFLHISHEAMEQTANPSRMLFEQLRAGRWLDRLEKGPETSLLLSRGGQIEPLPAQ
jgi:hypothetical protein